MCRNITDPNELSPLTLAFLGDAVYGLLVRDKLCGESRPSGELHRRSVAFVSAPAQKEAYLLIEPLLTEREISVFKRGRNARTGTAPRAASAADYHAATGLETLFGYLYKKGESERINELFAVIWEHFSAKL